MEASQYKTTCMCLQIRKTDRIVTGLYDAFIRKAGLKSTQYCLLRCIDNLGKPCLSDIASALSMDQTTVTRNVEKLKRRGLVSASPSSVDPRRTNIEVTPAGIAMLGEARKAWEEAQNEMKACLGEEEYQQLYNLLDKLSSRFS